MDSILALWIGHSYSEIADNNWKIRYNVWTAVIVKIKCMSSTNERQYLTKRSWREFFYCSVWTYGNYHVFRL